MSQPSHSPQPGDPETVAPIDQADPGPAVPLVQRLKKPIMTAWFGSLVIHLALLLIAVLITVGGAQAGGARDEAETIGVAIMTEAEFGQLSDAALDASAPTVTDALDDPLALNVDLRIPESVAAYDDPLDMSAAARELTSGLGAGDVSDGALGGAGGAASFFGVEARGTRFAYIVDISGSMDVGVGVGNLTRLDVLKRELQNSIGSLTEDSRFVVILFDHESKAMGGRLEWTDANDAGKAWARRSISEIVARGGTTPLPAFQMIFSMRPRPDAIYFMTDGEFHYDTPREVARLNADLQIPIHCICFDSQEGEDLMTRIAEDSGGSYTYVPGAGR